MIPTLIDTHIHLDDKRFDVDRVQILKKAAQRGISTWIIPGTTSERWPIIKHICQQIPGCYPAYGLHPWFLDEDYKTQLLNLKEWLKKTECVAIGECGLDFWDHMPSERIQRDVFSEQIELSQHYNLPLILHSRKSLEDVYLTLKQKGAHRGVIHGFNGSVEQAKKLVDLGFFIGLGGAMTYERAQKLHKVVQSLPLDSIVIETDGPNQPPASLKGKRNEPASLIEVLHAIKKLRPESEERLIEAFLSNANALFNLSSAIETKDKYAMRQCLEA